LITGFTDGTNGDTYTITTHNGLVTNGILPDAPAQEVQPAAIALAGLNAARDLYQYFSSSNAKFRCCPYVNPEQVN
jgi:hypothetical protein